RAAAPAAPGGGGPTGGLVPAAGARVEHTLAFARSEGERRELRPFFLDRPGALPVTRQDLGVSGASRQDGHRRDAAGLERARRCGPPELLDPCLSLRRPLDTQTHRGG